MTARLVLASLNPHKITELARILAGGQVDVELVGLAEFPARPRSPDRRHLRRERTAQGGGGAEFTGLPSVADDSGFCVDALNGMPGVLSARWSGKHGDDEANLQLLLASSPMCRMSDAVPFHLRGGARPAGRPPARQRG